MDRISRFVIWICSKFNREQIERIVGELQDILPTRTYASRPRSPWSSSESTPQPGLRYRILPGPSILPTS